MGFVMLMGMAEGRRLGMKIICAWMGWFLLSLTQLAQAQVSAKPPPSPSYAMLIVGDSLSAEYGLPRGSGWVNLLSQRLAQSHPQWKVINASISGETTAGGRSRIESLLKTHRPALLVIELGGNDALRGLPLASTQENLLYMAQQAKAQGARVLLLGMKVPPNYGADYNEQFAKAFAQVAKQTQSRLLPFFLEPLAAPGDWFQSDRIHPNEKAQSLMLQHTWPVLEKML
jgi:acyl-CoA thioesterase-1